MRSTDKPSKRVSAIQVDLTALSIFLATQADIVAAYLFGSLAEGRAHPHSDVDVAILLAGAPDALAAGKRQLQLLGDLQPFAAPRTLDIVILNGASPLLAHQVLRQGRLIYEGDRETRVEFEVRAGQVYADLRPMYEFHNLDLLRKIKEAGLGTQTSSSSTACDCSMSTSAGPRLCANRRWQSVRYSQGPSWRFRCLCSTVGDLSSRHGLTKTLFSFKKGKLWTRLLLLLAPTAGWGWRSPIVCCHRVGASTVANTCPIGPSWASWPRATQTT